MKSSLAPSTSASTSPASSAWVRTNRGVQGVIRTLLSSAWFSQDDSLDHHRELQEAEQAVNSLFQIENWGQWLTLRATTFEHRIHRAYAAKYQLDKSIRYLP